MNTSYQCYKCFTELINEDDYTNHLSNCKINKCKYCNKDFCRRTYLEKHLVMCKSKIIQQSETSSSKVEMLSINNKKLEETITIYTVKNKELEEILKIKVNKLDEFENLIKIQSIKIKELENTIYTQSSKINQLEDKVREQSCTITQSSLIQKDLNCKIKEQEEFIVSLQNQNNNKNTEIIRLKAIEEITNKRIEDLKTSTQNVVIYNNDNRIQTNNNQFANNIHNSTLIHSPESVLDDIDTQYIFQTNNIRNEEDFAKYFHIKGLTRYIQVTDKSRNKTKYLDKNSQVVKDVNCNILTDKIYTSTKESAKRLNQELNDQKFEIMMDGRVDNKREKNKQIKEIDTKSTLASYIVSKNKESMDKFGKCLTEFAEYNIKQVIDQHKNMKKFITKLISIINDKKSKIFFKDFKYMGEQLRSYLKKDIVRSKLNQHILIKNDIGCNEKIDSDFLLQFMIDICRGKNKELFIKEQLKNLLDSKYDNYINICNMANFFFDKQSIENLTNAKTDIINGITYDENMILDEY